MALSGCVTGRRSCVPRSDQYEVVASVKASCPIQTRRGGSRPTWQSYQSFPRKLISFQSRRSKAPAASKDIASSSPPSAAHVSNAALDAESSALYLSLKSDNFFTMTSCSASIRKAVNDCNVAFGPKCDLAAYPF